MKKLLSLAVASITLAGCASSRVLVPYDIDGSRADGTIVMAIDGVTANDTIDWDAGEIAVKEKCSAWGYSGFEAFSGVTRKGTTSSQWYPYLGVINTTTNEVKRNYQCTNDGV